MDSSSSTAAIWSFGLGLLAYSLFALRLSIRWKKGLRSSSLLAAIFLSALWEATGLTIEWSNSPAFSNYYARIDVARAAAWLLFILSLLYRPELSAPKVFSRPILFGMCSASLVMIVIALLFPIHPPSIIHSQETARAAFGALLGLSILGLVLVEQLYRNTPTSGRWGVKPICIGLGGAFVFDLFLYADAFLFGHLSQEVWSARGLTYALVIPFIAVSIVRNKDWTIDIAVSRHVVFHSTALLGSGLYLLAVSAAGYYIRYFGGSWGKTLQAAFLFSALLLFALLFSSGTFRSNLRVFLNKHFFSYRYDYREEWLRFTRTLSTRDPTLGIHETCIKALADLVESPGGVLWLRREDSNAHAAAHWNMPQVHQPEDVDASLFKFLETTGWVVNISEYKSNPARYPDLSLPSWLDQMQEYWLIVPLLSVDELVGFVVLANPRARIELNWEVLDLLKTAGRQAASYLAQIRASEALLEARKFDAFSKMSAFVVHDLKNLVAQLSLLLKNAERHRGNPEFQKDLLMTIEHVVERMNHMLLQLRSGTVPVEAAKPIQLEGVLERIQRAKAAQTPSLVFDIAPLPAVLGHEDRLERVIGHVVQNALDATKESGNVTVRVYGEAGNAVIVVADTGIGMSAEFVRDQLFKPFQTTKSTGMGIGAYESFQYISDLGGRIFVDSKPAEGTTIRIVLPAQPNNSSNANLKEVA